MRKITANKIFDGYQFIENKVIVLDDDNLIVDVIDYNNELNDVEQFEGIIAPGVINAHCHLELSHIEGLVSEGKGFV